MIDRHLAQSWAGVILGVLVCLLFFLTEALPSPSHRQFSETSFCWEDSQMGKAFFSLILHRVRMIDYTGEFSEATFKWLTKSGGLNF